MMKTTGENEICNILIPSTQEKEREIVFSIFIQRVIQEFVIIMYGLSLPVVHIFIVFKW